MLIAIILLVLVALAALGSVLIYNSLVKLRVNAQESLSDIDVQLKRRHDLIPNLVESVKGYAKHESSVFEEVTRARAEAVSSSVESDPAKAAQAEGALSASLMNLQAVAEQYPDLKASQNFIQLQDELSATEDKIAASRRYYNTSVRAYNTKIQQFPASVIAGMKNFEDMEFFELDDPAEKAVPDVSFS